MKQHNPRSCWCDQALLLLLLCLYPAAAIALDPQEIRIRLNACNAQWLKPHDEFFRNDIDLDTDQDKKGRLLTVRTDLNGDGALEYFLHTLCGNGGCEYPVFDGRSHAYLGSVFGSEVWLLRQNVRGMAVIESYGRTGVWLGTIGRYEFNGNRYVLVSSREIAGEEETEALYSTLKKVQCPKT